MVIVQGLTNGLSEREANDALNASVRKNSFFISFSRKNTTFIINHCNYKTVFCYEFL